MNTKSTTAKGRMLESIVASMHKAPGTKVETNVFLRPRDGNGRGREIDVLLTSEVSGYPIRVAIECKNYEKPLGVGEIDKFIGKLDHVGIPKCLGIFVSASRYTKGAINRAAEAGVRLLEYKDVTSELNKQIIFAFQSLIYLLLSITKLQVTSNIIGPSPAGEVLFFKTGDGKLCGSVPDLIWMRWKKGFIPETLGKHELEIEVPTGWHHFIQGKSSQISSIKAEVLVSAHVLTFPGTVFGHHIVPQGLSKPEKWQIGAEFSPPLGKQPIVKFTEEDDLKVYIESKKSVIQTISRYRLPRIQLLSLYWPPSVKTLKKLKALVSASIEKGEPFDLTKFNILDIEGDDLSSVWDPIIPDHPMIKNHR